MISFLSFYKVSLLLSCASSLGVNVVTWYSKKKLTVERKKEDQMKKRSLPNFAVVFDRFIGEDNKLIKKGLHKTLR